PDGTCSGVSKSWRASALALPRRAPLSGGSHHSPATLSIPRHAFDFSSQLRHSPATPSSHPARALSVISLWVGHEGPAQNQCYIEADLAMKDAALRRVGAPRPVPFVSRRVIGSSRSSKPSNHADSRSLNLTAVTRPTWPTRHRPDLDTDPTM